MKLYVLHDNLDPYDYRDFKPKNIEELLAKGDEQMKDFCKSGGETSFVSHGRFDPYDYRDFKQKKIETTDCKRMALQRY